MIEFADLKLFFTYRNHGFIPLLKTIVDGFKEICLKIYLFDNLRLHL
jgi:hypothetical protein